MSEGRVNGVVKRLIVHQGFGFVTADLDAPGVGGVDLFFHRSDLVGGYGLYFPTDRCVCGCQPRGHAPGAAGEQKYGHCTTCTRCAQYQAAPSPNAIKEGLALSFVPADDQKGPRAKQVMPAFSPTSSNRPEVPVGIQLHA